MSLPKEAISANEEGIAHMVDKALRTTSHRITIYDRTGRPAMHPGGAIAISAPALCDHNQAY